MEKIFKHRVTGEYLQLLTPRVSGINTWIKVNFEGEPILQRNPYNKKMEICKCLVKPCNVVCVNESQGQLKLF